MPMIDKATPARNTILAELVRKRDLLKSIIDEDIRRWDNRVASISEEIVALQWAADALAGYPAYDELVEYVTDHRKRFGK